MEQTERSPLPLPVPADLVEAYQSIVTPHISDSLQRLPGAIGLRPYHGTGKLVGTALTVQTRHGDNLLIHEALSEAREGDVIVVDGGGDVTQALVGEIMMRKAQARGVAGFVIYGAIRDVAAFRASDFPCYACGVTHKGPYKNGPGVLNTAVSVGGLIVNPGDLVVGDEDGLVSLSRETARQLIPAIRQIQAKEEALLSEIAASTDGARSLQGQY